MERFFPEVDGDLRAALVLSRRSRLTSMLHHFENNCKAIRFGSGGTRQINHGEKNDFFPIGKLANPATRCLSIPRWETKKEARFAPGLFS